ncbi:MAG TPA: polysaccharide biosynthesis protein, partial [Chloroflexia bacterium]|nr:polysaccharide biosynthesis protein [Chloroflexia bacterium]
VFKFRTMIVDADQAGSAITAAGDARITSMGRWLRRTKLDELPQLLNVVRGEMSLVGPRPEDPRYVAFYTPEQRRVLCVRPGITGAASLTYRNEEALLTGPDWERAYREDVMPAKLALDLAYLTRRTLLSDMGLILQTVSALVPVRLRAVGRHVPGIAPLTDGLLRLRNRHFLAADVVVFLLTPLLALSLRVDGTLALDRYGSSLAVVTGIFLLIKLFVLYRSGLYSRFWRYASIEELAHIMMAGILITGLETVSFLFVLRPAGLVTLDFPRSVPMLDGLLMLFAVGGLRYSVRLADWQDGQRTIGLHSTRVLVAGAGEAGVLMVEEMQANGDLHLHPVGFVDDDPHKQHLRIRGVEVLGTCAQIAELVRATGAGQVIIAMPRAPGKVIHQIVASCEQVGVQTKIVPGMYEILGGSVSVNQLRTVDIVDLLRREIVRTDDAAVRELVRGKRVLVTGGGGSIGSELCRQLLHYDPAMLVVLGHGENSVFEATNELRIMETRLRGTAGGAGSSVIRPVIADIRFASRLRAVFADVRPDIVFHAAAHKHVPLMEANASEAVTNNVVGTRNVLDAARACGVSRLVMLSTDKAVNPTSIMGATKRTAELLVHEAAQASGRPYVAVRFGNVLGSRGSVVHTFKRQIAMGGPVTVTHPDIERFFMTIPEAVSLVLQAAVLGQGGEVFVLDMGEPVKLVDMARDLIALSGLQSGHDLDIVFTGLRPGEKLYEELFVAGEEYERTRHHKIFIAAHASSVVPPDLAPWLEILETAAERDDSGAVRLALQRLVPEFRAPDGELPNLASGQRPAPVVTAAAPVGAFGG